MTTGDSLIKFTGLATCEAIPIDAASSEANTLRPDEDGKFVMLTMHGLYDRPMNHKNLPWAARTATALISAAAFTAEAVASALTKVYIPAELLLSDLAFAVNKVLDCGRLMISRQRGYEIPEILVVVHITVDRLPQAILASYYGGSEQVNGFVPASKESIKVLERVRVLEDSSVAACAVCLEEFIVGSEAIRLPCSHHFHQHCIVKWLNTSKFCPLCRFEMPS